VLAVSGLGVTYDGLRALTDVSIEVAAGEFVTLVGPNGAGKTTLLKAISGSVPAAEGRVVYKGRDVGRLRPNERAALGIAHVPEGRRVFATLTVRENLELGSYRREARRRRAEGLQTVLALFPLLKARASQLAG
jgi:branched-chain amino acid transport system ATP-binding protein